MKPLACYREIEHTADWELEAWAPDLPGLLEQAARGMAVLSGMRLQEGPRLSRSIEMRFLDAEVLVVGFLSRLLLLYTQEGIGFDAFDLRLEGNLLEAHLTGAPVVALDKEIKAVTYHNLAVRQTETGLAVNIVFDV